MSIHAHEYKVMKNPEYIHYKTINTDNSKINIKSKC